MLGPALLTLLSCTRPALAQDGACWDHFTNTAPTGPGYEPGWYCTRKIAEHFAATYPDQVQLHVYGYTEEGRPLIALRVTSDATTDASWERPVAMFLSRTHGDEHGTERNTLGWLHWLLEYPADDGDPDGDFDNAWLLDNRQIWVVPSATPDGHAALGRCSSGIDPNRDFALGWRDSSSVTVCKDHSGTYPFSVQSTRALANFAEWVGPQIFVDVHGYKTTIKGDGTALANLEWNWKIYAPDDAYFWNAGTSEYNVAGGAGRSLGDDVGYILWRDPSNADALPELGEYTGAAYSRYYYPYDPGYVGDPTDEERRGVQVSIRLVSGHTPQYFWARLGALSMGYEILYKKVNPVSPYYFLSDQWYDVEEDVVAAAADARYPFNRIVELAANPIPQSSVKHQNVVGGRSDLAITRIADVTDGCSQLRTFPKQDVTTYTDMLNGPVSGSHTLGCQVTNWGDQTLGQADPFDVTLTVSDLTNPALDGTNSALAQVIAGGDDTTVTLSHSFLEGHDYVVTCEIQGGTETDGDGEILIEDDQGCTAIAAEFGDSDVPDWCVPDGNDWDSKWGANNVRTVRFTAGIADDTVCRDGTVVATDGYGHVVGHIAAVVAQ